MRDNVNIKLSDATALSWPSGPSNTTPASRCCPANTPSSSWRATTRPAEWAPIQTNFVIPNLNKEVKRIPISAVVLSSQRVDLNDAIYDAAKTKERAKNDAVNPLVQDGKKLIPSVTRVFSTGHQIYVYFQAYKQKAQPRQRTDAQRRAGRAAAFRIRHALSGREKNV